VLKLNNNAKNTHYDIIFKIKDISVIGLRAMNNEKNNNNNQGLIIVWLMVAVVIFLHFVLIPVWLHFFL
jgi:hypothetical protein